MSRKNVSNRLMAIVGSALMIVLTYTLILVFFKEWAPQFANSDKGMLVSYGIAIPAAAFAGVLSYRLSMKYYAKQAAEKESSQSD